MIADTTDTTIDAGHYLLAGFMRTATAQEQFGRPTGAADSQVRFQVNFLFPTAASGETMAPPMNHRDIDFGGPAVFRIVVQGALNDDWSDRLAGMAVTTTEHRTCTRTPPCSAASAIRPSQRRARNPLWPPPADPWSSKRWRRPD